MKIRDIVDALERFAPLPLQEEYDNSGLQIGLTETEVSGALLCLDVTEPVVAEAVAKGCNLIVSHHPLLFHPLRCVSDATYTGRCVIEAVKNGISVYSAHTNLDNAQGGVNYRIAEKLGLGRVERLRPGKDSSGAGVIGTLPVNMDETEFISFVKKVFAASGIRLNGHLDRRIGRVAVCGGAGSFLIDDAIASGADAFITGEVGYHRFFGMDNDILVVETGHYESEQYTVDLLYDLLHREFPYLHLERTSICTNPIRYY